MASKVSIIGAAGTLGSCAAFAIASQGLTDELVMLDVNENLLKCHVMDISQAITGLRNVVVRAGTNEDLSGSDVVIIAAGAPWRFIHSRLELLNDSLPVVRDISKNLARYCPEAVAITATNPVDPLNDAVRIVTGMDHKKLIGYSLNDSTRFRMMVAKVLGVQSTQVEGYVIGEHGEHQVMLFSTVKLDGQPVTLSAESKALIKKEVPNFLRIYEGLKTGRTSGWTSAVGLASMVSAILQDTGEVIPGSAFLEGEYGHSGISASVPLKLGREGIREILEWELTPDEHEGMDRAVEFLKGVSKSVKEFLTT